MIPHRLESRLEASVRAFLLTDPILAALESRPRDDARVITPKDAPAKEPRLIVVATDQGRHVPRAPIRRLQVAISLRSNAKTPAGQPDPFDAEFAALENLLDSNNLTTALDSQSLGVRVMLATRQPAPQFRRDELIRTATALLDIRAVRQESVA